MNLLSSFFDMDKKEISLINKKYLITLVLLIVLIISIFFTKKNSCYHNSFTVIDDNIVLLVDKEYVDSIQANNKIIINNIKANYSINSITSDDSIYLININLDTKINNITGGDYNIYLGKESLFNFILRIIEK